MEKFPYIHIEKITQKRYEKVNYEKHHKKNDNNRYDEFDIGDKLLYFFSFYRFFPIYL